MFDALVIWTSAVLDVANLSDFSPGHGRELSVQVHNELVDLRWQSFGGFPHSALFPRGEETRHPLLFKRIRFSGQRALGDIDFFGSLPRGFMEQDERPDLLVEFLFRPQRPLLDIFPLLRSLSARSLRAGLLSDN